MLSQPSPDLKAKLVQIEEQLQLAMQEFPERIAIDRLKFALAPPLCRCDFNERCTRGS